MRKLVLALLLLCLCPVAALATRMRLTVPEEVSVGQPFFVEMRVNENISRVTLNWRGKSYPLGVRGNTVRTILGVPNDAKLVGRTFTLAMEFDCGRKGRILAEREVTVTDHKYPRQELKVAPKMVNPPHTEQNRIVNEKKLVDRVLAKRAPGPPLPAKFVRPVRGIPTAFFGGFRVYNGVPRSGHNGLDLRAATGTQVKAIADGTVVLTGRHYFSGGAVYIEHGNGVFTSYFHLSKVLVKKGQRVRAGSVIALSGATGRVTGPHLHLGLYAGGTWLDALPLFGEAPMAPGVEAFYEF